MGEDRRTLEDANKVFISSTNFFPQALTNKRNPLFLGTHSEVIQILFKTLTGKTIILFVEPLIAYVRAKVKEVEVPHQQIFICTDKISS